jgi:hypothetical protein
MCLDAIKITITTAKDSIARALSVFYSLLDLCDLFLIALPRNKSPSNHFIMMKYEWIELSYYLDDNIYA